MRARVVGPRLLLGSAEVVGFVSMAAVVDEEGMREAGKVEGEKACEVEAAKGTEERKSM